MTDFANIAAASTAGYAIERGSNGTTFYTNLVKLGQGRDGEDGEDGDQSAPAGHGNGYNQTDADTQALASLNGARSLKYGWGEPATASTDELGAPEVVDQT